MAYGVTKDGFVKKRLSDIKQEIENTLRQKLGNKLNLTDKSVMSQIVGVWSDRESSLWELAEDVYNSNNPDAAEGVGLDNIGAITNVLRLGAAKTLQQGLHLFGVAGTPVPAGTQVSVDGSPDSTFLTKTSTTLVTGVDEQQTITPSGAPASGSFRLKYRSEVTAPIAWNATAQDVEDALNALSNLSVSVTGTIAGGLTVTFDGNSGKIDQPLLEIDDNSVQTSAPADVTFTMAESVKGVPQGSVDAEATAAGPIVAPAFSLTVIDTPVAGLERVTNPTDAIVGRSIETDPAYRIRRRSAQASKGAGTVPALRQRLLELTGVTQVVIFSNRTNAVDGNGLPPKSYRAYVQGGADQEIWDAIWAYGPAGIESDGTESGIVVDDEGFNQTVKFSRPDQIEIYVAVELTTDTDFPSDGAARVRTAIADFINAHEVGEDVIVYPKLIAAIGSVPGIIDIEVGIDTSPNPTPGTDDNNITIAVNEIAKVVDPANDVGVTIL